jgi:hypothetical protein
MGRRSLLWSVGLTAAGLLTFCSNPTHAPDAGTSSDGSPSGPTDGNTMDASLSDAGSMDSGAVDSGGNDGGTPDGGSSHWFPGFYVALTGDYSATA